MKKKILVALGALSIFAANGVQAATLGIGTDSYASISAISTGEDGPTVVMEGTVQLSAQNYSSSSNSLYMELYKSVAGPDTQMASYSMNVGKSGYGVKAVNYGNYYTHLDPSGPNYTGCNGYGLSNNP